MVFCVARGSALVSLVARNGRVLGRFHFRGAASRERALEHAFQQLGFADTATEDLFSEVEFEEFPDFSEICASKTPEIVRIYFGPNCNEPLSTSPLGNEKETNVLNSVLNKLDGTSLNQIANETHVVSLGVLENWINVTTDWSQPGFNVSNLRKRTKHTLLFRT